MRGQFQSDEEGLVCPIIPVNTLKQVDFYSLVIVRQPAAQLRMQAVCFTISVCTCYTCYTCYTVTGVTGVTAINIRSWLFNNPFGLVFPRFSLNFLWIIVKLPWNYHNFPWNYQKFRVFTLNFPKEINNSDKLSHFSCYDQLFCKITSGIYLNWLMNRFFLNLMIWFLFECEWFRRRFISKWVCVRSFSNLDPTPGIIMLCNYW
jgi:hypothetical protein